MITFPFDAGTETCTAYFPETSADIIKFYDWALDRTHFAVDTETTGLDQFTNPDWKLRLVQIGDADTAWLLDADKWSDDIRTVLDCAKGLAFFNLTYDTTCLAQAGLVDWDHLMKVSVDVRSLAHLLDNRGRLPGGCPLDLKSLASVVVEGEPVDKVRYRKDTEKAALISAASAALGRKVTKDEMWRVIPIDNPIYLDYAARDAVWTFRLAQTFSKLLATTDRGVDLIKREKRLGAICASMTRRGFLVDVPHTEAAAEEFTADTERMAAEIAEQFGIKNVNSSQQVLAAFHRDGVYPKDEKGKDSTARACLEELTDSLMAVAVLEYRVEKKALSGTVLPLLEKRSPDGRIHANFKPLGTTTARMSCAEPNLQQMPKRRGAAVRMRGCLQADPGMVIVAADLSQIEYRVAASLSKDAYMLKAYENGEDLHNAAAKLLFHTDSPTDDQRTASKNAGFGKIYGAGPAKIATQIGGSLEEAQNLVDQYDRTFTGLDQWSRDLIADVQEQIEEHGSGNVTTPYGRKVYVDPSRPYAAVNYMVQSTARDILVDWLFEADTAGFVNGSHSQLLAIVHDEMVFQCEPWMAPHLATDLETLASEVYLEDVPVVAEAKVGSRSWGSLYVRDVPVQDSERSDTGG